MHAKEVAFNKFHLFVVDHKHFGVSESRTQYLFVFRITNDCVQIFAPARSSDCPNKLLRGVGDCEDAHVIFYVVLFQELTNFNHLSRVRDVQLIPLKPWRKGQRVLTDIIRLDLFDFSFFDFVS